MVKKKNLGKLNIGKMQFVLGILLIVSSLFSGVYVYNDYNSSLNFIDWNFSKEAKYFLDSEEDFESKEIQIMSVIDVHQSYFAEKYYINLKFIILESLCIIIFIQSLFFITQGLINLRKK